MLISSSHNLNLCSDSQDTRLLWNVFEAVQKTRSTCFIGSKTTRLRLVVLNPIKHSCSFFEHYIKVGEQGTRHWLAKYNAGLISLYTYGTTRAENSDKQMLVCESVQAPVQLQ